MCIRDRGDLIAGRRHGHAGLEMIARDRLGRLPNPVDRGQGAPDQEPGRAGHADEEDGQAQQQGFSSLGHSLVLVLLIGDDEDRVACLLYTSRCV